MRRLLTTPRRSPRNGRALPDLKKTMRRGLLTIFLLITKVHRHHFIYVQLTEYLKNKRWYEVRAWSRELAKTARTMMEVTKLSLTGEISNVLYISNSYENAERLLTPVMITLESNPRIINDYGVQQKPGDWESGEFTTTGGCSFRALGAGQSPRGTRNEAARPDFIVFDDIDTDKDVRNPRYNQEAVGVDRASCYSHGFYFGKLSHHFQW